MSGRVVAAALAGDLATSFRFDLTRRAGARIERSSREPPESPVPFDLYTPSRSPARQALLLTHGLAAEGRRDGRLARVAAAIARAGLLVLVPDIATFRAHEIGPDDTERMAGVLRAAIDLSGRIDPDLPFGAGGFSYAAGPLFTAAARRELSGSISALCAFGGFYDMRNVISFALTGRFGYDGETYRTAPSPFVRGAAARFLMNRLEPAERDRLEGLIGRAIEDGSAPDTKRLSEDPRAPSRVRLFARLLLETDPAAVLELIEAIDPRLPRDMDRVSPARVAPEIPGRVVLAHSTADELIPFTESLHLRRALEPRGPCTLGLIRAWTHVDRASGPVGSPRRDERGGGILTIYRLLREVVGPWADGG